MMLVSVFTKTTHDRWKGMAIGSGTLALLFVFGMAVYRDIDLSVYTDLPESVRSLMNISQDADVASLAYGAIYGSYGAMTLAGLTISMGAASIAGEERDGTLGLLLGNPQSRTHVLISKTASMVLVTAFGAVVLWAAGRLAPVALDVSVAGLEVGAFVFHMYVNALFYGFLALAVGGWTGKRSLASGLPAAVMVVSFFAVGFLPLVEGVEWLAEIFPWYYFTSSDPLVNGVGWSHIGVLLGGCAIFSAAALVGVNQRDLRGRNVGVTLLDRLRANDTTKRVVDRLAGSTRVSRIWVKTASEHQGLTFVVSTAMFFVMGLMIGPMYNLIDEGLRELSDTLPELLMALVGGGDMSTPEGFYQAETFGLMAPIAVMSVGIAVGSRALAGEEARNTMGLLLANPVSRSSIVLEKTLAMVVLVVVVGLATFAGVVVGSVIGGLGMSVGNIAATSLLVTLLGLVIGTTSLALAAATGRTKVATFGAVGIGLISHVLNAFLPHSERLAGLARWTPNYYYLTSDPLNEGMHWGHGAVLAGLTIGLIALSVVLFERRDLR